MEANIDISSIIISICLGIGLAASAGFRVFVPLFASSLAAYYQIIPISDNLSWIASTPALITLAIASIFEASAYLIPFVDNLLDTLAVPLAGIAGTLVMAASITNVSPEVTWALAIIAGGGTALTIKGTSATGRAASSATTAGTANPIIAVGETGTAIGLSVLAIFVPILAMAASIAVLFATIWLVSRLKKKLILIKESSQQPRGY